MANYVAAKRYAKALFALSNEQQVLEDVHADMQAMHALMNESPEWSTFVQSPFGALEKREAVLKNVLNNRAHALTSRFMAFINRKRRMQLLPEIYTAWLALHDEAKGVLRAHVISAISLDEPQIQELNRRLSERFKKDIIMTMKIDAVLIGGVKIFIGDHVFDYSIESQLQDLHRDMLHV